MPSAMGLRHQPLNLSRRGFVAGALAGAVSGAGRAADAHDAGDVTPPQAPPRVALTLDDASASTLAAQLAGRVTALQLMFTSCQATCPIQGALFGAAAKRLGERLPSVQLLSVSIDPEKDSPAALKGWLKRFGASPRWRAARPDKNQLDGLVTFLKSKKAGSDPHTGQVYFFTRKGELTLRTVEFPPATEILRLLEVIAAKG
jgi:protein SCO1